MLDYDTITMDGKPRQRSIRPNFYNIGHKIGLEILVPGQKNNTLNRKAWTVTRVLSVPVIAYLLKVTLTGNTVFRDTLFGDGVKRVTQ